MPDPTTTLRLADLVDTSTVRDDGTIGMTGRVIRGARVPVEHVARAWLTNRGQLRHAKNIGIDLRRLQNATAGPGDFERWRAALVAEARAVPFVRNAKVTIAHVGNRLKVRGEIQLVDGLTYPLAVALGDAGAVISEIGGS